MLFTGLRVPVFFRTENFAYLTKLVNAFGEITNKFTPELVRTVDQFLGVQAQGKQGSANQIHRMTKIADEAGLCLELYPVKAIPHRKSGPVLPLRAYKGKSMDKELLFMLILMFQSSINFLRENGKL